jgi:hypothetical protein
VFGFYGNPDPASHIEGSLYPTPVGFESLHQIIEDGVGDVLMKDTLVAIRPQVQLEGFGFKDLFVRDVLDRDRCEIWLLCCRANAGEFIGFQPHHVSALRMMVWEGFQLLARAGTETSVTSPSPEDFRCCQT